MKGEKNILNYFRSRKYVKEKEKERYYNEYGITTLLGRSGSGKTLTAVKIIRETMEKYPKLNLVSNVKIKGLEEKTTFFTNTDELIEILKNIDIEKDKYGYLIFIDEFHVVLAEIFGKTDPIFLQFLSQQRKLAIHIIGTSQMFDRIPKFMREYIIQSGNIIICKNYFKVIQINKYCDMDQVTEDSKNVLTYKKAKLKWFIHNKELYESYDTYAVISQIKGLMKGRLKYGVRLLNNNESISEQ